MERLVDLCKKKNIALIEDAAESIGTFYKLGRYKKRHTGTIGIIGCLSFNGNKKYFKRRGLKKNKFSFR